MKAFGLMKVDPEQEKGPEGADREKANVPQWIARGAGDSPSNAATYQDFGLKFVLHLIDNRRPIKREMLQTSHPHDPISDPG